MKNEMYHDEFEHFLQDEIELHRMYPSDKVWTKIRVSLHGYKSWPALTIITLIIITSLTTATFLSSDNKIQLAPTKSIQSGINPSIQFADVASFSNPQKKKNHQQIFSTQDFNDDHLIDNQLPKTQEDIYTNVNKETKSNIILNYTSINESILPNVSFVSNIINTSESFTAVPDEIEAAHQYDYTDSDKNEYMISKTTELSSPRTVKNIPLKNVKHRKTGFRFYVAPSRSFRKLTDEKLKEITNINRITTSSIPYNLATSIDVNQIVRHQPGSGIEIGVSALYELSKKLNLTAGLQANIRRYEIQTYQDIVSSPTSLALISSRGIENMTVYSSYRNDAGAQQTTLENNYYQLSLPLGIQWELLKNNSILLNVEATVQPTYNLSTSSNYLLSTDFSHYTEGDRFIRRWNINTGVGVNIGFRSGKTNWQVGPQIRYQQLPTYSNKYPVRENLVDYGFRLTINRDF